MALRRRPLQGHGGQRKGERGRRKDSNGRSRCFAAISTSALRLNLRAQPFNYSRKLHAVCLQLDEYLLVKIFGVKSDIKLRPDLASLSLCDDQGLMEFSPVASFEAFGDVRHDRCRSGANLGNQAKGARKLVSLRHFINKLCKFSGLLPGYKVVKGTCHGEEYTRA